MRLICFFKSMAYDELSLALKNQEGESFIAFQKTTELSGAQVVEGDGFTWIQHFFRSQSGLSHIWYLPFRVIAGLSYTVHIWFE